MSSVIEIKENSKLFFVENDLKIINELQFIQMVQLYKQDLIELEEFSYCFLNHSNIDYKDFDTSREFFKKYDSECLEALYNGQQIFDEIVEPIKIMERDFGCWRKYEIDKYY